MNTQQTIALLKDAENEIKRLRQSNQLMSTRLDMFDKMVSIFEAYPNNRNNGMCMPDTLYDIGRAIEELSNPSSVPDAAKGSPSLSAL